MRDGDRTVLTYLFSATTPCSCDSTLATCAYRLLRLSLPALDLARGWFAPVAAWSGLASRCTVQPRDGRHRIDQVRLLKRVGCRNVNRVVGLDSGQHGQSVDRFTETAYHPTESRLVQPKRRPPPKEFQRRGTGRRYYERCLVHFECGLLLMREKTSCQHVAPDQARANYKDETRTHLVPGLRGGIQAHSSRRYFGAARVLHVWLAYNIRRRGPQRYGPSAQRTVQSCCWTRVMM